MIIRKFRVLTESFDKYGMPKGSIGTWQEQQESGEPVVIVNDVGNTVIKGHDFLHKNFEEFF